MRTDGTNGALPKAMPGTIRLPEVVGRGYATFWNFKGRYRVVKGSRASKKSKTTALNMIVRMIEYPQANLLVVRKVYRTLADSCFTELKWAINRLGVAKFWQIKYSPLEMIYTPTGQKILFRGLDDPLKITSVTVEHGFLCWVWIEEAYEIMNESDFDMIDESIRGALPKGTGLFKQITLTFNPWNDRHWLKSRFFDTADDNILAMTTNYMCNEWLDDGDRAVFENMKRHNPKRYQVAGLGDWGVTEGVVYDNWIVDDLSEMIPKFSNIYNGLDFGVDDPNALIRVDVEIGQKKIYIFDEWEQGHVTLERLANEVKSRIGNGVVICDSAGKQNIIELCSRGIKAMSAIKGADSILFGIQWLQGFDIIIDKRCKNTIREISQYQWAKDKENEPLDKPVDKNNHLMDALRYAVEPLHFKAYAGNVRRL